MKFTNWLTSLFRCTTDAYAPTLGCSLPRITRGSSRRRPRFRKQTNGFSQGIEGLETRVLLAAFDLGSGLRIFSQTDNETLDISFVDSTHIQFVLGGPGSGVWDGIDQAGAGVTGNGLNTLNVDVSQFAGPVSIADYPYANGVAVTIHGAGVGQPFPFGLNIDIDNETSTLTFTGDTTRIAGRANLTVGTRLGGPPEVSDIQRFHFDAPVVVTGDAVLHSGGNLQFDQTFTIEPSQDEPGDLVVVADVITVNANIQTVDPDGPNGIWHTTGSISLNSHTDVILNAVVSTGDVVSNISLGSNMQFFGPQSGNILVYPGYTGVGFIEDIAGSVVGNVNGRLQTGTVRHTEGGFSWSGDVRIQAWDGRVQLPGVNALATGDAVSDPIEDDHLETYTGDIVIHARDGISSDGGTGRLQISLGTAQAGTLAGFDNARHGALEFGYGQSVGFQYVLLGGDVYVTSARPLYLGAATTSETSSTVVDVETTGELLVLNYGGTHPDTLRGLVGDNVTFAAPGGTIDWIGVHQSFPLLFGNGSLTLIADSLIAQSDLHIGQPRQVQPNSIRGSGALTLRNSDTPVPGVPFFTGRDIVAFGDQWSSITFGAGTPAPQTLTTLVTFPDSLLLTSEMQVEIRGLQPGTEHGQAVVTGEVAIGLASLVVTFNGFTPTIGDEFTIIDNDDTDPVLGQFRFLPEGAVITTGAGTGLQVSYVGGDGNDVVLTAVDDVLDFGDAPDSYPVTLAEDGARHLLTGPQSGPLLGQRRDGETDGTHSAAADYDDLTGVVSIGTTTTGSDEDGVVFSGAFLAGAAASRIGQVTVDLTAFNGEPDALLDAWVDWNRDGDWDDADEQILASYNLGSVSGQQVVNFTIPQLNMNLDNVVPGVSFARFRISTAGGLSTTGEAMNGEVEDHAVTIAVDGDAPELHAFVLSSPSSSVTNADTLVFRARFNEAVKNVTADDFVVDGLTTATVTGVTVISPSLYEITVSGGDLAGFEGTVGLNLAGGQNITDLADNPLPADEPSIDDVFTVENTPPAVTGILRNDSDPTNATSVTFTVTFSEDVTGIGTGDFVLATTGTASGSIDNVTASGGSSTVVTVTGLSGNGSLGLNFDADADGGIVDAAGNVSDADFTGEVYTLDSPVDLVFQLPAAGGFVVLEDADPNSTGTMRLRAVGGTFQTVVFATPTSGTLTIRGSRNADIVSVLSFDAGFGADILIDLGDGDDRSDIDAVADGTTTTVDGGDGNDTFTVGLVALDLDGILGTLFITGGDHFALPSVTESVADDTHTTSVTLPEGDRLFVFDQSQTEPTDYSLSDFEFTRGSAFVSFETLETIDISTGFAANSIVILTTPGNSIVRLSSGGSADDIDVLTTGDGSILQINPPGAGTVTSILDSGADSVVIVVGDNSDFGDAPTSYGDAWHLPGGPRLGLLRDLEAAARSSSGADGDDNAGDADEDGVVLPELPAGTTATITVNASRAAFVDAFIDWNRDGDFDDDGETVLAAAAVVAGDNDLMVDVPAEALTGQTYARFRISSDGGFGPTGSAIDGEVEDYLVDVTGGVAGPGFSFDFAAVVSDLHPTLRFFGQTGAFAAPLTIVRYGTITITSLTGFPASLAAAGGNPENITVGFGSSDPGNPTEVVSLAEFDDGTTDDIGNQNFRPNGSLAPNGSQTDNPTITIFNGSAPVAQGVFQELNLEVSNRGTLTSMRSVILIQSAVGGDSTIFDEIMSVTGGSGLITLSLDQFDFPGTVIGFEDAEIFVAAGQGLNGSILLDDHGDLPGTATAWDRVAPIAGRINDSDDVDVFAVQLEASTEYTFRTVLGSLGDSTLSVLNAMGTEVAFNDDDGDDPASLVTFITDASGTYYLVVDGFASIGGYTLHTVNPAIIVAETDGSTVVSERGDTDTFTVVLSSRPNSNVVLQIASADTGEVTVSTARLTFTPSNWDTPQTGGRQAIPSSWAATVQVTSRRFDK